VSEQLTLLNGVLYNSKGEAVYDEADYFADVQEAQRWLKENGVKATVKEEEANAAF
jgi:hypothetical protein